MYVFNGRQKAGRGRKKQYDGKINTSGIDKRRLPCCYSDEHMKVYVGIVYCVRLRQTVLAAFMHHGEKKKTEIIISTDTEMEAMVMCRYYGMPNSIPAWRTAWQGMNKIVLPILILHWLWCWPPKQPVIYPSRMRKEAVFQWQILKCCIWTG